MRTSSHFSSHLDQNHTAPTVVVPRDPEEARVFYGIPDYIPAPPPEESGRRYVVIKGVTPGIYNTW